ncbi:hypothetical protein O181_010174 [Austropuccinia psidii MF-1]|uniref:Uncharacterized protein n=1 Tax=Austropuccinia psidii MF-1 TaxID=1389203 RepID=A0A9Q3BQI9_9BASI|nr:hypothetical protein [Austropuccinia psidii MF-1]
MVGSFSNIEESWYSCLPSQWKSIHPVFHISLLEPVKTSTIPNWHQEPPPPIIIEEEEEGLKIFFHDAIPPESLFEILLNSLNRLLPWFGAQDFTIQGGGTVTTMCNHPCNGCCGNYSLTPFYGQLGHTTFHWPLTSPNLMHGLKQYPALIGLFGQLSISPTLRPIPLVLGLGVLSAFQGPLASLATTKLLGLTPLIMGLLAMGPLGPFLPKSNEAKRGQVVPKPQVGPPEPILAPNLTSPRNGQSGPRTQIGHF